MYQLMQLNPAALNAKRRSSEGAERRRYTTALLLRDVAILGFAILYISLFNLIFGDINSSVAVSSFCMLLGIRFVDYGYHIGDGVFAIAIVMGLLFAGSVVLPLLPAAWAFAFNFAAILLLLRLTTTNPAYGNGGLYTFGYIFITGNPVSGHDLISRAAALAVVFVILSLVLIHNHHEKVSFMRLHHVLYQFSFKDATTQWHLRLALGVATALLAANFFHLGRPVWMGYAAMSCLQPLSGNLSKRAWTRFIGVATGCLTFALLYRLLPNSAHFLLGPIAGLGLGLTGSYYWASVLNCFGALMIATSLFGVDPASTLRLFENGLGLLVALVVAGLCHLLWQVQRKSAPAIEE